MTRIRTGWKPPLWLLAVDAVGIVLLGLGLFMQYNPQAPLAQGALAVLRLPLLVAGGAACLLGALAAAWLAVAHLRQVS
ncbi:hypothetical protein [Agrilutibacter solisilvae]|uniref:Uncharacterized protein n=1 Tax=Agrilutibacter solisilvae TaxID=2763317 RepID=A0A974Y3C8_9GAMM|nr:hypothetical protein [Lysobacter solisilvae]QSX79880.1 hypothetical protein I8J32_008675 [Lysobacter solisilvae]